MNGHQGFLFTTLYFLLIGDAFAARSTIYHGNIFRTQWFSEEQGKSEIQTSPIVGIGCRGRYCDDKRLLLGDHGGIINIEQHVTREFSEEGGLAVHCPDGWFVTQIFCSGGFCDNMKLRCGRLREGYGTPEVDIGGHEVSEEQGEARCPNGYYLSGLSCSGSYCGKLHPFCTSIQYDTSYGIWRRMHLRDFASRETKRFSEEYGGYSGRTTGPVYRTDCERTLCDDKKMFFANLKCSSGSENLFESHIYHSSWLHLDGTTHCPTDRVISEVKCERSYCSRIRLTCQKLKRGFRINRSNVRKSNLMMSTGAMLCPDGFYAYGIFRWGQGLPPFDRWKLYLMCVEVLWLEAAS